ncbi:MAG: hypothetical protein JNK23_10520 [Opitutaceae bacterium]|nr:hypothetical protein [Opitutaceae bacterium]
MSDPASRIAAFVIERLEGASVAQRITTLTDLAALAATNNDRRALLALVDDLKGIERKHRQLVLDFNRRSAA